jgi:hypothetical protein
MMLIWHLAISSNPWWDRVISLVAIHLRMGLDAWTIRDWNRVEWDYLEYSRTSGEESLDIGFRPNLLQMRVKSFSEQMKGRLFNSNVA